MLRADSNYVKFALQEMALATATDLLNHPGNKMLELNRKTMQLACKEC